MKIFPKVSKQELSPEMEERIRKSEGVELQFFNENGLTAEFNFWDAVVEYKNKFPNLKEMTIHPPLDDYNFEMLVLKDKNMIIKQLRKLIKLSEELDINLNMLYHNYMTKDQYISTNLMDVIKEFMEILEGTRVTILLENIYMLLGETRQCSIIEICKYVNNEHLRACIDTTHMHCKANIYKVDFYKVINEDLNREDCEKYVKQVHFAATLNGDGYIDKNTHGRKHESYESLAKEYNWVKEFGMGNKNFVTEISEEDYYSRKDQLEEIRMLEQLTENN